MVQLCSHSRHTWTFNFHPDNLIEEENILILSLVDDGNDIFDFKILISVEEADCCSEFFFYNDRKEGNYCHENWSVWIYFDLDLDLPQRL